MSSLSSIKESEKEQIWKNDLNHFIHPYTNFCSFKETGSSIYCEGKDHFIYDDSGVEYIDGIAGLWCVNIGHGNTEMVNRLAEQAKKLAYYNTFGGASSPPAAMLAAKLAEICPGDLNHVFFGTGGSMANDTAIKIVHYYNNILGKPNKKKIISRNLGYHGSTYLAHALTGIQSTHIGFDLPFKDLIYHLSAPYDYRRPDNMSSEEFCDSLVDEFENKILELGPENVACFIAEPIMGAGGVIVPPKGYNYRTWQLCKKYDIIYIADEVVTAFGRLGHMVASEDMFNVQPDILIMAKGISSGYIPLGATMISDAIYDVISSPKEANPYFSHGFTYSGHALACASGLINIEIMEKMELCAHVREIGPYFESELKNLLKYSIVGDVRGSHFMMGIEFVMDQDSKENFDPAVYDVSARIFAHCKKLGFIVRPVGPMIVLSPPLTFDKEAIDKAISILSKSIENVLLELETEKILT